MATNGNSDDRLEKLELALTGSRPPVGAAEGAGDVLRHAEAMAEQIITAGRYAREHGQYLDDISQAHAKQLQADAREFAKNFLAAEERKQAELSRILGKITG